MFMMASLDRSMRKKEAKQIKRGIAIGTIVPSIFYVVTLKLLK